MDRYLGQRRQAVEAHQVTDHEYAGNSPEVIWLHYAREFERSRTAVAVPLEGALHDARRAIAKAPVPAVFPELKVVELDDRRSGRKRVL